ncbi:MAG TPA: hypothetical protein VFI62_00110, partial [Burkholderiales bacterium]|nr:hypothetical protein [Burkholderiales bacterium]
MTGRLTPEATAVYDAASNVIDEDTGARTTRLPSLVFRTADRQGGTYHLTYTHSAQARADRYAWLQVMVLYPETDSHGAYDTAQTPDGLKLVVRPLKCERAEGFQTEQLSIRLPAEALTQHALTGLRVRVSRADDGAALSLDVPAAHVQALLALSDPSTQHADRDDDATKPSSHPPPLETPADLNVSSPLETPAAFDAPAVSETPTALDVPQHERPIVAQHHRPPRQVVTSSRWPLVAAGVLIAGIFVWRFWFSDGVTPVQPQPARAPAQEQNTQNAQVETAPV